MCLPPSVFQTKHNVRSQTEELLACVCECVCILILSFCKLIFLLPLYTNLEEDFHMNNMMLNVYGAHSVAGYKGKSKAQYDI